MRIYGFEIETSRSRLRDRKESIIYKICPINFSPIFGFEDTELGFGASISETTPQTLLPEPEPEPEPEPKKSLNNDFHNLRLIFEPNAQPIHPGRNREIDTCFL